MEAFKRYNFDQDENFKAYMRTVELPSGENEQLKLRVKAKWYKKNVDPDFDTSLVTSASKPSAARTPATNSTGGPAGAAGGAGGGTAASARAGGGYTPRAPPPPPQTPPPRYGSGGSGTYGSVAAQRRLFFMHLGMLLLGVFVAVPFLPYSRTAYVYLMRLSIMTLGYKIYLQHGLPAFRPLSMLMAWVQRVLPTSDFLQLLIAFSFSAQPPLLLVAGPLLVLAAYHVAAFCAAHFSGHPLWQRVGSRVHAVMLRKQADALLLNAYCEIGTAAVLLLQLLTPARSFLTLIFYAQILKLKLHVPECAVQHRQVWRKVDELTLPYRLRAPALERFVQMAVNWFMNVPGAQ